MDEKKYTEFRNGREKGRMTNKTKKKTAIRYKKLLTGRAPYPSTVLTLRSNLSS
jgi:hypothetical protein